MRVDTRVRRSSKVGLAAIVFTAIVLLSMIPLPLLEAQSSGVSQDVEVAKAEALRIMLAGAANLNISTELKISIEALLRVDVSKLDRGELREWIANASKLLARVEKEVREGRAYAVGVVLQRYLNGLVKAVEARARKLNISDEEVREIIANLSTARTAREAVKILERLRERIRIRNAERFAVLVVKRSVEGVENGSIEILRAQKMLEKVARILNTTLTRLKAVNASEKAIEAVTQAIERVEVARDILEDISLENISIELPRHMPALDELIRKRIKTALNRTLPKIIEKLLNEISELREEVIGVLEESRSVNATHLVERLEALLQQLDGIASKLANISVADLHTVIEWISRIKREVRSIKRELRGSIDELPRHFRDPDKFFSRILREVEELIEHVKKIIERLSKINTSEVVCIAVYPPPPACRVLEILPEILEWARRAVAEAQENVNRAVELYNEGRKSEAIAILLKTKTQLVFVKFRLEYVENLLRGLPPAPPKPEPPIPRPTPPVEVNRTAVELYIAGVHTRGRTLHLILVISNRGADAVEVDRIVVRVDSLVVLEKSTYIVVGPHSTVKTVVGIDIDVAKVIKSPPHHEITVELYRGGTLLASASTPVIKIITGF